MAHDKVMGICENKCMVDITDSLAPTGSVISYAGSNAPEGWLICNGQAVSRTDYAALFAAIGTTYGAGNGSSTFNVPNLVNKTVRGSNSLGKSGGSDTVTLSTANMPAHTHGAGSLTVSSAGEHTHDCNYYSGAQVSGQGVSVNNKSGGVSSTIVKSAGAHTHTISGSTASTGSGSAVTITNPYVMLHYIIKT